MDEVYEVFVANAPHRDQRELIFGAFKIYTHLIWGLFPNGRLWLNGGFVTHKESAPHDLDVAFLVEVNEINRVLSANPTALSLFTLQDVTSVQPSFSNLARLQPFGGLIDSFFVPSDIPAVVDTWKDQWSTAPNPSGIGYRVDLLKGFLEVRR